MLKIKKVHWFDLEAIFSVAEILNKCGKNMAQKYGLHHWDNTKIKSLVIVGMCVLKNDVYLIVSDNVSVATFQVKCNKDTLFFEKLAVLPAYAGKGLGGYCLKIIENKAKQLHMKKIRMKVYDKSQHAIDFYLHKGYSQVGVSGTLKYKELVMEKTVGE